MAFGDLRKAERAGDPADHALVLGVAVGVHEHDRDRVEALRAPLSQRHAHRLGVGRGLDGPVGQHALVDLDHARIKLFGLDDGLGEDFGARLVADLERVAETARRDEQRALAAPLEQRIGRDRRAHLDRANRSGGDRLAAGDADEAADRLDRGVVVERALRQELQGGETAGGIAADDVGEGAAAVDPKIPAALRLHDRVTLVRAQSLPRRDPTKGFMIGATAGKGVRKWTL